MFFCGDTHLLWWDAIVMSEPQNNHIGNSAGLSRIEMFRASNPYYRSFEERKRECRQKGYPVWKEWAGPRKYDAFHTHVLELLGLANEDIPRCSLPKYTIKFIDPTKGLVPGNLKPEKYNVRNSSMNMLVNKADLNKIQSNNATLSNPEDDPDEDSDLDPTKLSGAVIVKNTSHVYPRPRLRNFSSNFVDKDGNINPDHSPRDADVVSVRQYKLGDPKAAEKGVDIEEAIEDCKIINYDYGTDSLDVMDKIFSVFGKVADPKKMKEKPGHDPVFDNKIQQILAKHSHDPEIRRLAWEDTYWVCYLPDCNNLVTEEGLCFRHMIGKRTYERKQKLAEEEQQHYIAQMAQNEVTTDAEDTNKKKRVRFDLPSENALPETESDVERDLDELFGTTRSKKPK